MIHFSQCTSAGGAHTKSETDVRRPWAGRRGGYTKMLMQKGNQNGYAGSAGGHNYESAGVTATDHTIRKYMCLIALLKLKFNNFLEKYGATKLNVIVMYISIMVRKIYILMWNQFLFIFPDEFNIYIYHKTYSNLMILLFYFIVKILLSLSIIMFRVL